VLVFAEFGPQNSEVAVPTRIEDGTWRHHEGSVEVKQLRVECVTIKSIFEELVHFASTRSG
jgi:hypothetical protein